VKGRVRGWEGREMVRGREEGEGEEKKEKPEEGEEKKGNGKRGK
jgi:hypothetical protein